MSRKTRQIRTNNGRIGGNAPAPAQSMTTTSLPDNASSLAHAANSQQMGARDEDWMSAGYPRPDISVAYQAPSDEIEQTIAEIWQDLFGIETIGIFDNFFDLGGDSLLALNFTSRLRETFNVQINMREFLEIATIKSTSDYFKEKLSQIIESVGSDAVSHILDEIEKSGESE